MIQMKKSMLLALVLTLVGFVSPGHTASKDILLQKGWNLVSTPLQPVDTAVEDVLSGLEYVSVWKWLGNNWAVTLFDDSTASYTQAKGFQPLSTINAGEGFWLNMEKADTLTISGNAPSSSSMYYQDGWNLVGLKQSGPKGVVEIFPDQGLSAWAWDEGWSVYLPEAMADYAASKGYYQLVTVNDTDGFWVSAGESAVIQAPTDPPPQVGTAYAAGGSNNYNPLANAEIYINGSKAGVSNAQGTFSIPEGTPDKAVLEIIKAGFTVGKGTIQNGVIFVQKLDPKTTFLISNYNATSNVFDPVNPNQVSSTDNTSSLSVGADMKLTQDIAVQLSTYLTPLAPPACKALGKDNIQPGKDITSSLVLLGGASVDVFDGNSSLITPSSDTFDATLIPTTTHILGGIGEALNAYSKSKSDAVDDLTYEAYTNFQELLDAGKMSLHTLAYDPSAGCWESIGPAVIEPSPQGQDVLNDQGETVNEDLSQYCLTTAQGVSLSTLRPYAFVLQYEDLFAKLTAKAVEGGYKMPDGSLVFTNDSSTEPFGWYEQPIEGVMAVGGADVAVDAQKTPENGTVVLSYTSPYLSPVLDVIFKKEGYFDASLHLNALEYFQDKFPKKTVPMYRIPDTASLEGYVREKASQDPISGALVSLMNPDVLDEIQVEQNATLGTILSVEKKPKAEYVWEYRKHSETQDNAWKVLNATDEHFISTSLVRDAVISQWSPDDSADPTGSYDLRITVTHISDPDEDGVADSEYVEEALGHFEVLIDLNALQELVPKLLTGSISQGFVSPSLPSKYAVYGGSSLGWYEFSSLIMAQESSLEWTTSIQAQASEAMFMEKEKYPNVIIDPWGLSIGYVSFINVLFESDPIAVDCYPYAHVLGHLANTFMLLLEEDPNNPGKSFFKSGFTVKNTAQYTATGPNGEEQSVQLASYFDLPEDAVSNAMQLLTIPELVIMPNTTFAYLRQLSSKEDGFYRFNLVPANLNSFLEITGDKPGYIPDSKDVNDLSSGQVSHHDLILTSED